MKNGFLFPVIIIVRLYSRIVQPQAFNWAKVTVGNTSSTDANGNSYVTGSGSIAKYDSAGNCLSELPESVQSEYDN